MSELFLLLAQETPPVDPVTTLLQTEKFIPAVAIVGGLSLSAFWVLMHYFFSWVELCKNSELKLRMIEAGHSAEEIERVICAGKEDAESCGMSKRRSKGNANAFHVPPAKPVPQQVA